MRILVTGGGGFLGSHLVERLERDGHDVFVARRRDYDLTRWEDGERLFQDRGCLPNHLGQELDGKVPPNHTCYLHHLLGLALQPIQASQQDFG